MKCFVSFAGYPLREPVSHGHCSAKEAKRARAYIWSWNLGRIIIIRDVKECVLKERKK